MWVKVWPVHRSYAVRTLKLRAMLRVLEVTAFCISNKILSALTPTSSFILFSVSLDTPTEYIDDDVVQCNLIVGVMLTHLPSSRFSLRPSLSCLHSTGNSFLLSSSLFLLYGLFTNRCFLSLCSNVKLLRQTR